MIVDPTNTQKSSSIERYVIVSNVAVRWPQCKFHESSSSSLLSVDGLVSTHWMENAEWMVRFTSRLLPHSSRWRTLAQSLQHRRRFFSGFMSFLAFGVIFVVSASDPKGFFVMIDKVVSLSLNMEVGLFIFLMLRTSRSERFKHITVPLMVSERLFSLHWVLPVYFLFAVAYDIFQSVLEITVNMSLTLNANSSLL